MASARDRLNVSGDDEKQNADWRIERFKLDPTNRTVPDIDVASLIVGDPELELPMEEPFAPVLRLPVEDNEKHLLTGDLLTGLTWGENADDRDEERWIKDGRDVDATLDAQQFRLRRLEKTPDRILTLVFEDRAKVALDSQRGARKVYRDKFTRAQFVKMLADAAGVPSYIPELTVLQPVSSTDEPLGVRLTDRTHNKGKVGLKRGLTLRQWDGGSHTLIARETENAETVLETCASHRAPTKATLACLEACIVEAPMFANPAGGEGTSQGILQLTAGKPDRRNIQSVVSRFLLHGFAADTRGAIKLAKTTSMSTGQIAQTCQGSAHADRYGKVLDSAKKVLDAWGGAVSPNEKITEEITSAKRYAFKRGRHETSWAAIQRLAEEVGWRAFIRSGILFYVSESLLFDRIAPALEIEERKNGVESIEYEIDLGARDLVAEMTVQAVASRWTALPGMSVIVRGEGAADGKWLVSHVNPALYEGELATITLRKPVKPKAEPAPETTSRSVTSGTGGSGSGSGGKVRASDLRGLTPKEVIDKYVLPIARKHGINVTAASVAAANRAHSTTTQDGGLSDHKGPPNRAWAADMSNGVRTKQERALATELAQIFGIAWHYPEGGLRNATHHGFRFQLIHLNYPKHDDHVHFGVRRA